MKIKSITLSVFAALYASGVGAAATGSSGNSDPSSYRNIEITESIVRYNEDLKNGRNRSGSPHHKASGQNQNVHRDIAVESEDKIPFVFETDISGTHLYIVEMSDKPAAQYQGGIPNLAATSARSGKTPTYLAPETSGKLDINTNAVKSYQQYLTQKQDTIVSQMRSVAGGQVDVTGQYSLAFNGVVARMTQDQAASIANLPGVRQVTRDKLYELHTDVGPEHIGADKLWTAAESTTELKGEGIVIGVIDTGINSDHPSFAEVAADGYEHMMPERYDAYIGDCAKEEFIDMCNDKLIGVHSYPIITDSYSDPVFQPNERPSRITPKRPANGEDYNGHGSHTAATSGGNVLFDVKHVVGEYAEVSDGSETGLVFPQVSGVAPRANIIVYQACFPGDRSYGESVGGCPTSALLASIEDAIADQVDVINYSIGSQFGGFPWEDSVEMAFLSAREAGISVAASAGNSYSPEHARQARGAIDHLSPWVTSVAATTHGRMIDFEKTLTNSTGGEQVLHEIMGGGITPSYTGLVVAAKAYGSEYEKCNEPFPAGFFDVDPDGVPFATPPIVTCKRGDIPRVTKAVNIEAGGAGGLILWNASPSDSIANDAYVIPGINISYGDYHGNFDNGRFGVDDWLKKGTDHTITIAATDVSTSMGQADYVADFSSRGPNLANPNVMSPNLAAPGVRIFAAYADEQPFTLNPSPADYASISGTSMAAPHVAGAMALLKQAHMDWTPAQIQSALMTTASNEGVTRSQDFSPYEPVQAGYSDAGSGVINVARANNVGLLMDESSENYRAANPKNGGDVSTLNMPYLYDNNCASKCSWMRTFTATQDGTWDVSAEALTMDGAQMLFVEAAPAQFSLKAGETQSIRVSAEVLEIEAPNADSSQVQLYGRVDLKPTNTALSDQYLPVGVRYSHDDLPKAVSAGIHRSQGHILTPEISSEEVQSLNSRVYGLHKGVKHSFALQSAIDRNYSGSETGVPMDVEAIKADPGADIIFFDVPEGTKRIIWEVKSVDASHAWTSLDLGKDVNNDEDIQWSDEALCFSFSDVSDYCAVNNPSPGRYWAIAANWKWDYEDEENRADIFEMSLGIVSADDAANMTVEGPTSTDGVTPYQLRLNYDLADAQEGDTYYGMVSIGSDEYNDSNLGDFPVKLEHLGSDVSLSASQSTAKAGDIINYEVKLAPNLLGAERDFTLSASLPESYLLLEDSVTVNGQGDLANGLVIENNLISITGTQSSSAGVKRGYVFTTNHNDESCVVPYGDNPAFYDISYDQANIVPVSGRSNDGLVIRLSGSGLPHVPLYGNPEKYADDVLTISPFGYVQFDQLPDFYNWNKEFNDAFQNFPDTIVGPLWRGDVEMPETPVYDFALDRWKHQVYAIVTDKHYVFQWDGGVEAANRFVGNLNPDPNASFNVETIIATDLNFAEGEYEIYFAYDTIESANDHLGSIGLHGYYGERELFGPKFGYLNDGFAFNDVNEKAPNGTVVCADYHGPEQSGLSLTFSARVSAHAVGTTAQLLVDSQFSDSELLSQHIDISTPSNIQVSSIADQSVAENGSIEGIELVINDLKNTKNGIEVNGEHVSATVTETSSGAMFDLTPAANWHGETEVTVSVFDMAYPTDRVSTTFMLSVVSDGIELGCTDSVATNFDSTANQDNGSCQFAAEVSSSGGSSSGSSSWLILMLLPLAFARKRKM